MRTILTSLHGRRFGLNKDGALVINRADGVAALFGQMQATRITSAQVLALNATPRAVVTAPLAGLAVVPTMVQVYKPAGTAYAGIASGEDLVLKYTNGSGAQCSAVIEATGFLDQATAQHRVVGMMSHTGATAGDTNPTAGAAVVMHLLTGEITTGTSDLLVRVWYDVVDTVFSA
jgi:hypothetical protein